ncbi:hypothetical protein QAD02_019492 [Eretmocerus hayati]|uniref:Uncharacterized protein n=1 Tax=Eretmocerus hayati TaxID=131215 RepID=A0ACC2PPI6_9HYME|nr:hypothetical protein QAD02_019492 [Eretmocerus hayati]
MAGEAQVSNALTEKQVDNEGDALMASARSASEVARSKSVAKASAPLRKSASGATFARFKVVAASEQQQASGESPSPRQMQPDVDASYCSYDLTNTKNLGNQSPVTEQGPRECSVQRREPKRRSAEGRQQGSRSRAGPPTRGDCSITQFAQIDDVSALQQVTRGGGGLTLASQWKSQFDDSEETDNEWKAENLQSPEHKANSERPLLPQSSAGGSEAAPTLVNHTQSSLEAKEAVVSTTQSSTQQHQLHTVQNALSRINEDLPRVALASPPQVEPATTSTPAQRCLNITGIEKYPELQGALPRAWSVPVLAPHVRSDLEAPLVQQAAFDDLMYEVDVMRNIATRHDEPKESSATRRASVPMVPYAPPNVASDTPAIEEEEQAVAGRLEIRVVDATGGATVVQTSADKEPLQKKLTNGTRSNPASPNPGPEVQSISHDATEDRTPVCSAQFKVPTTSATSTVVTNNVVTLRDTKDGKDKEPTSRPHSIHSKIPVPVRSPKCSLSESTPETNTPNTRTVTSTDLERVSTASLLSKDRDSIPILRRCATLPDARPPNSYVTLSTTSSTEEDNLTGCTPALRRRRQSDKYVTDASQLNLRFQRPGTAGSYQQNRIRPSSELAPGYFRSRGVPSHLLADKQSQQQVKSRQQSGQAPGESSDESGDSGDQPRSDMRLEMPPPPPPSSLPPHTAENNARCRRFRPIPDGAIVSRET